MLLERRWTRGAEDASLWTASRNLHGEVVTTLLQRLKRVSEGGFQSALCEVVQRGSMELFTALVTNVASDATARRKILSGALETAASSGQVRSPPQSQQQTYMLCPRQK